MNKLHYGIALILFIMLFASIPILYENQAESVQTNKNQTVGKSQTDNETTEPVILNVTTNLRYGFMVPDSQIVNFNAFVEHANSCFLSYSLDQVNWTNQIMTNNGNSYTTTLNTSLMEYRASVNYRIHATDNYGHSNETEISKLINWNDP